MSDGPLQRPLQHGWEFPNTDDRLSRVHVSPLFRKAARRIGLDAWRFHDLRHHGVSVALNAGFSGQTVRDLGGWKSEAILRRYAVLTSETMRTAAEAVAAHRATTRLLAAGTAPRRARAVAPA